jgi:hypothetical protein
VPQKGRYQRHAPSGVTAFDIIDRPVQNFEFGPKITEDPKEVDIIPLVNKTLRIGGLRI